LLKNKESRFFSIRGVANIMHNVVSGRRIIFGELKYLTHQNKYLRLCIAGGTLLANIKICITWLPQSNPGGATAVNVDKAGCGTG
jgi:hypothetical protein